MINAICTRLQSHIDDVAGRLGFHDPISDGTDAFLRAMARRAAPNAKVDLADDEDLLCGSIIGRRFICGTEYSVILTDHVGQDSDGNDLFASMKVYQH